MKHLKWILPILIIAFCFLGFLIAPHNPEAMDIANSMRHSVQSFLWGPISSGAVNYPGFCMADM